MSAKSKREDNAGTGSKKKEINKNSSTEQDIVRKGNHDPDEGAGSLIKPNFRQMAISGTVLLRNFNSLPLYACTNRKSDVDSIFPLSGMDCMQLTAETQQLQGGDLYHNYNFHPLHHIHNIQSDQTKSLQELQNEVGALLEFRDLVIETFPDLKHKMASMSTSASTSNTLTGIASNSSLASRREWEPGIRIKRKILHKESSTPAQTMVTSTCVPELPSSLRSRSNSHSGKKEPKSGEGNGSVVQDSGFSTETSSSKEAHSASSTTGALQLTATSNRLLVGEADDELLNLLDVIHRKSNRLRDEVENLQNYERDKMRVNTGTNTDVNQKIFYEHVEKVNKNDIRLLRRERDRLLDKLAEMEAETLTGRIRACKINDQVDVLVAAKKDLEEQLKLAMTQKLELNSRFLELNKQSSKSSSSQSDSSSQRNFLSSATTVLSTTTVASSSILDDNVVTSKSQNQAKQLTSVAAPSANTFQPVVVESDSRAFCPFQHSNSSDNKQYVKQDTRTLGHLDNLVSTPCRNSKVRFADSKKIAAILLETNAIELQRHLLTLTVQNQVLLHKLDQATRSKIFLIKRLDKFKEDVDDLKFQLEEKNIELEGTKAQLRVIEAKMDFNSTTSAQETTRSSSRLSVSRDVILNTNQISTPSMKAMVPVHMDDVQHHSSSTESAYDQTERHTKHVNISHDSEKRMAKPSKIPLPGVKGHLAPKPPTSRNSQKINGSSVSQKSLSRSTGSLGKSLNSLSRPDSVQSNRKDSSISTNSRSSSTSIPVSAKTTPSPHKILTNSPLPKLKRDSLTARVRHFNSLSRVYNTNTSNNVSCNSNQNSNNLLSTSTSTTSISQNITHSPPNNGNISALSAVVNANTNFRAFKKDLNHSSSPGQFVRKQSSTPLPSGTSHVNIGRRFSSASVGRGNGGGSSTDKCSNISNIATMHTPSAPDQQQNDSDSGKNLSGPQSFRVTSNFYWTETANNNVFQEYSYNKTGNMEPFPTKFNASRGGDVEFSTKVPNVVKRSTSNNSDESFGRIWYRQPMSCESKEDFKVNKVEYSEMGALVDEVFFDSIDGQLENSKHHEAEVTLA